MATTFDSPIYFGHADKIIPFTQPRCIRTAIKKALNYGYVNDKDYFFQTLPSSELSSIEHLSQYTKQVYDLESENKVPEEDKGCFVDKVITVMERVNSDNVLEPKVPIRINLPSGCLVSIAQACPNRVMFDRYNHLFKHLLGPINRKKTRFHYDDEAVNIMFSVIEPLKFKDLSVELGMHIGKYDTKMIKNNNYMHSGIRKIISSCMCIDGIAEDLKSVKSTDEEVNEEAYKRMFGNYWQVALAIYIGLLEDLYKFYGRRNPEFIELSSWLSIKNDEEDKCNPGACTVENNAKSLVNEHMNSCTTTPCFLVALKALAISPKGKRL